MGDLERQDQKCNIDSLISTKSEFLAGIPEYRCPSSGQVFSDCAAHKSSCRDAQFPSQIPDDDLCIAGCQCQDDKLVEGNKCVALANCSCYEPISRRVYRTGAAWKQTCGKW